MTRIFAQSPCRNIPDPTAAVQRLERLLAEAGELHDRIASACTGPAAGATRWPGAQRLTARNARLLHGHTRDGS